MTWAAAAQGLQGMAAVPVTCMAANFADGSQRTLQQLVALGDRGCIDRALGLGRSRGLVLGIGGEGQPGCTPVPLKDFLGPVTLRQNFVIARIIGDAVVPHQLDIRGDLGCVLIPAPALNTGT